MPEKGLWTRTYSTRDQVPDRPVFTRAKKINSPFGDNNIWRHQFPYTFKRLLIRGSLFKNCRHNIYMYVYKYIYIYVCMYTHTHTHIYIYVYIYIYIYKHLSISIHMYTYIYVYKYIHMCICVCISLCMCVCMCMHTVLHMNADACIRSQT